MCNHKITKKRKETKRLLTINPKYVSLIQNLDESKLLNGKSASEIKLYDNILF